MTRRGMFTAFLIPLIPYRKERKVTVADIRAAAELLGRQTAEYYDRQMMKALEK